MLITALNDSGHPDQVDVDDDRVAAIDGFLRSHQHILGLGAGKQFDKRTARDAAEALSFAVNQLAYTETKLFERQYQPLLFEKLLGGVIDTTAGPWAQTVEYQIIDYVGMGKRISNNANDIPYVDSTISRVAKPVVQGGVAYKYNTEELRISAYLKRPLSATKLLAANMAYKRHINKVALVGEAQSNFTGLFNATGVTAANRPSGAVWDAATAATIIADIMSLMTAVHTATATNDMPTKVVFPVTSYQLLLKPRSDHSDMTILSFLKQTYPDVEFLSATELEILGAGVTKRVVAYNPNNENMVLHLPMALTFIAPQMKELDIVVVGEYKYGGFEPRRTPTIRYMDGV
jgi:hypothetical protein